MNILSMVSIVVPAYNEEGCLTACLSALQHQTYQGAYEIILVNNASTDHTAEIAKAMGVHVMNESHKGYVHAMSAGFAIARGEIIASTDADTIVPPDWLERIVQTLQADPTIVATGGIFRVHDCSYWLSRTLSLASRHIGHPSGGNMAVRKWAYQAAGGFNPQVNMGADSDLIIRLHRLGRVTVDKKLTVITSGRRYQYALWQNFWKYPLNEFSLKYYHRPIFHDFPDIREPGWHHSSPRWLITFPIFLLVLTIFGYTTEIPKSQILGTVLASAHANQPVIALTFDDGPSPSTNQILEILNRYQVKATFFLIGRNIERHPDIPAKIVAGGNVVGNHTYSHSWWTSIEPAKNISFELDKTSSLIQATTHTTPTLFRPPRGLRNPWMIRTAQHKGYAVITWSIQADDWDNPKPSPEVIAQRVLRQAKPGAIILLHDGLGTRENPQVQNMVAALPIIIEALQAQGYRFVTIPDLMKSQNNSVAELSLPGVISQPVCFLDTKLLLPVSDR